jgi:hypothetical protein
MNLEERVEVVEKDVTALHAFAQKTHAEREGWYNNSAMPAQRRAAGGSSL